MSNILMHYSWLKVLGEEQGEDRKNRAIYRVTTSTDSLQFVQQRTISNDF